MTDRSITLDNVQNNNTTPEVEIQAPTSPSTTKFDNAITSSLAYDLSHYSIPSRQDHCITTDLPFTKVCHQSMKLSILSTANKWGLYNITAHIQIKCVWWQEMYQD